MGGWPDSLRRGRRAVAWLRDGGEATWDVLVRMSTGLEAGCRGQNCPPQALDSPVTAKLEVFRLQQVILENIFFKTMCLRASMSSQNSEDL